MTSTSSANARFYVVLEIDRGSFLFRSRRSFSIRPFDSHRSRGRIDDASVRRRKMNFTRMLRQNSERERKASSDDASSSRVKIRRGILLERIGPTPPPTQTPFFIIIRDASPAFTSPSLSSPRSLENDLGYFKTKTPWKHDTRRDSRRVTRE